jgi:hypothetical protein
VPLVCLGILEIFVDSSKLEGKLSEQRTGSSAQMCSSGNSTLGKFSHIPFVFLFIILTLAQVYQEKYNAYMYKYIHT